MNERDTHFQIFASLVLDKIDNALGGLLTNPYFVSSPMYDEVHQILTQSDYDLAVHVVESLDNSPLATLSDRLGYHEDYLQVVSDLTKWPDSPNSE